ncbi:MAG: phosphoglycerate mutase (2,3-diphosphoglycerate-independent) [Desulfobulbaceae bacterium A2]|nr:MAG: phosphoglycerate mutase (2,3-diphosphoglycerate-independent) [Desulfobulbaceae bacterium A2]
MARTILLAILDGWGCGEPVATNAVFAAATPNMDRWVQDYPHTTLTAHNGLVGLPEGQMGNSEVGHLNIGAGRIVYQDFTRINLAVAHGDLGRNQVLHDMLARLHDGGGALHLLGLVSDGGVHSHLEHLLALVAQAKLRGIHRVYIHAFMDGRDTPPRSGAGYMLQLQEGLAHLGCGQVATVCGRYFAMDRDRRWDRVQRAWQALVDGQGIVAAASDPEAVVTAAYARGETDEFIQPTVLCGADGAPVGRIRDNDALIFFNFRADRARQFCHALVDPDFNGFPIAHRPAIELVTMTEYEADNGLAALFPPVALTRILGEEVSGHGLRQLRIAETEKYAHVTYFFNGGREEPFPNEERQLINSPREVATYDLKPQMSAPEVTARLLAALVQAKGEGRPYDLVVLNFANGDMVGHTGVLPAAITACETVDECLGRVVAAVLADGGACLVTADHGNAEMMVNPATGGPHTAHTLNPVPLLLLDETRRDCRLRKQGALKDIAPTILELLGLPQPAEMEGVSLLDCRSAAQRVDD